MIAALAAGLLARQWARVALRWGAAQLAAANTFAVNQNLRSIDETAAVGPVLFLERLRGGRR